MGLAGFAVGRPGRLAKPSRRGRSVARNACGTTSS